MKHTAVSFFPQANICHYFMIFFHNVLKFPIILLFFIVHMAYDLDNYSGIWCVFNNKICYCEQEVLRSSNMILCKNFKDERFVLNNDGCI